MRLSRKHKLYVGIMALAAAALLTDRLLLQPGQTGPAQAQAAAVPTARPAGRAADQAASPAGTAAAATSVSDRLAAASGSVSRDFAALRDVFQPSASWLAVLQGGKSGPAQGAPPAEVFRQRRRLSAVMVDTDGGLAVVDRRLVKVGEQIDGFELISVAAKSATFAAPDGAHVELVLPEGKRDPQSQ